MAWVGIKNHVGRNSIWKSDDYPDVLIRHCGHPTALRPYYIQCNLIGDVTPPKFKRLQQAIDYIEAKFWVVVMPPDVLTLTSSPA